MNIKHQGFMRFLFVLFATCVFQHPLHAREIVPNAKAGLDGKVDIAEQPKGKWLPVPIPMSNPTVGSGLQGVLLYLHPAKPGDDEDTPEATSGIGGMYTDSDSKALGVFHNQSFGNDRFRLKAMAGVGDLNLDFFGIGDKTTSAKINYNIKPKITFIEGLMEIPGLKNHFLGISHLYADAKIKFSLDFRDGAQLVESLPGPQFQSRTSSLGLVYNFDSRDDSMYPRRGANTSVSFTGDEPGWGSDYEFQRLNFSYRHYIPLAAKHTLATKLEFTNVDGDPPFYFLATLSMRGFATGRYMDSTSGSAHLEWRYELTSRWGVNVFGESGRIGDGLVNLLESRSVNSAGVGIRWQPIVSKELNLGIDVAKSTDDSALYLRVGEAF